MNSETAQQLAAQLRQPHGPNALEVGKKMATGNQLLYQLTIDKILAIPVKTILEVGMGNGAHISQLTNKGIQYIGCDFSEPMVQAAIANNLPTIKEGKVKIYFSDIAQLLLPPNSVDCVFTINTIYFWENPSEVLSNLFSILQPGGRLLISLRSEEIMKRYPFTPYGFTLYSEEKLRQLITEPNWKISSLTFFEEPAMQLGDHTIPIESIILIAVKQ